MLFKSLLSSLALLTASVSAVEYRMYNKRAAAPEAEQASDLYKRAYYQITDDIAVSTSADGLTSTVVVDITYTYNLSVAGFVVAPTFDLEAGDYGYTVVAEYDTALDLEDNLDKWQFIHQADDGQTVLLTPDCSNLFTLLDPDTGDELTYDVCYSIGSLAAEFSFPSSATASEATATAAGTTVVAIESTVYITSDMTTTTATVACPICTGSPTTYYVYTATETVSGTVTSTVTVPCSTKTGYPVTEAVGAIIYTATVVVSDETTVTSTVECGCTAMGLAAGNTLIGTTGVATGSVTTGSNGSVYAVVPTSTEGTSTYYKTVTTIATGASSSTSGVAAASSTATATAMTGAAAKTGVSMLISLFVSSVAYLLL